MYPATNPSYVHIGAGVYEYGDRIWYVIHAAYTSGTSQYTPNPTQLLNPGTSTPSVSQIIIPVQTVAPDENGAVIHEVLPGQALWSIAIAYDTKIDDLIRLNNLNRTDPTIYVGQKLLVFEAVRTHIDRLAVEGVRYTNSFCHVEAYQNEHCHPPTNPYQNRTNTNDHAY